MTRSCRLVRPFLLAVRSGLTHWSPKKAPGFTGDIRLEFVKNWYVFVEPFGARFDHPFRRVIVDGYGAPAAQMRVIAAKIRVLAG
jgi:hypothetical protein